MSKSLSDVFGHWRQQDVDAYHATKKVAYSLAGSVSQQPQEPVQRQAHAARQLEVGKGGIQAQIHKWCASQWPRWKVYGPRSDKRSTLEIGACDMVVFARHRVFCVEVKRKGEKPRAEQRNWIGELAMLGHRVHIIHSLAEFIEVTNKQAETSPTGDVRKPETL